MSIRSENSGLIAAFVVNSLSIAEIIRCCVRILFANHYLSEKWYRRVLLWLIGQVLILVSVFWWCLMLVVLTQHFDQNFTGSLTKRLNRSNASVIVLMLTMQLAYIMSAIAVFHSQLRIMSLLEDVDSERLMQHTATHRIMRRPSSGGGGADTSVIGGGGGDGGGGGGDDRDLSEFGGDRDRSSSAEQQRHGTWDQ